MAEQDFDPSRTSPEKLQAEPVEAPVPDRVALQQRIAEKVRADSQERGAVTPELAVRTLAPLLNRQGISEVLAEMAAQPAYADIKAVIAPSGRLYLFSETHLTAQAAQGRGQIEEAKLAMVSKIRADSGQAVLTAAADLEPLFPSAEPEARAALLAELRADERFRDIQVLAGAQGEVFYHSDASLSATYGAILLRARSGDPCLGVAELVRERSRVLPRPTRLDVFHDPVFAIAPEQLEGVVADLLARPEHADVKKMVHPTTGSVYLYSDRFLEPQQAFLLMDWDEVGAAKNP